MLQTQLINFLLPASIRAAKYFTLPSMASFSTGFILMLSISVLPVIDTMVGQPIFNNSAFGQRAAEEEEGRRAPPPTRSSQTLSRRVYQRIEDLMVLRDAEDYAGAITILDEIKEMYDEGRLNDREQYVMWQFYGVIRQSQDDYEGAIDAFNQILLIDRERVLPDQLESTYWSIGALQFFLEQYEDAIETYKQYLEVVLEPNEEVYIRMGSAYYQIEDYIQGVPQVLKYMEVLRAKGEEVPQNAYSLLRAMYITMEDYPNARQILREMIILYGESDDWIYLAGVEGQMENFVDQALIYWVSNAAGYLDTESQLMNLAAQMFNSDNPYGAAVVVHRGMDNEIIEANEDNLTFLGQCYQVAREDERAAIFFERAAAMAEDGELYNRLGTIYATLGDFEKSVEAFDRALEKGGVSRPDQVYLKQARSYLELNRHDEGIEAAREAGEDERSKALSDTWVQHIQREKQIYEKKQENRRLYEGFFL